MKSSILKVSLLAMVSLFAFSACSANCPLANDGAVSACGGKCEKESCAAKKEGKTCGMSDEDSEKKSCCGK